jgi:hypothetical protein
MSNQFGWKPVTAIKGITSGLGHVARSHTSIADPVSLQCPCKAFDLKHIRTKLYKPKANGKAKRFIQTALREWTYART